MSAQLWERTGESHRKVYHGRVLHREFAERLNKTADMNPNVPPLRSGRLTYIQEELNKRNNKVTLESVRKWFSGESKPHERRVADLAEILRVDEAWLMYGTDPSATPAQRRARNALVDGAVNLLAGMMQMDGATIAFPDEGDRFAISQHIDIRAIIRGASYDVHVLVAEERDGRTVFSVPTDLRNTVALGVVREDEFNYAVYEITDMAVEMGQATKTGRVEVQVTDQNVRQITSFRERF